MSTNKSASGESNRTIAWSASIIGLATLCSRLLGFIRDVVIARLFGVYIYAQAFVIAFKIPNLFRDFVGEGAVNAAFVPVFSQYWLKHTKEEFWELANVVLNILLVVLAGIVLLGAIFSPLIVRIIAPGFIASPEKFLATVKLNRIIFPYLLLISLSAYSMGILNSLKHFAVPAFAPCLLNISIILFAMLFGENIQGLALGVMVGGILQLAVQLPVLYKKGFRLKFSRRLRHPAANTILRLMGPRVASSSIYQLNNFIDTIFGSLGWIVGEGGVAVLYFSYRLILFPLGIFGTSLSQAILPTFSGQALEDNFERLKDTLSWGIRATFFVMLPASIGFMVLSRTIISTLFAGGRFDITSVDMTANALFFYSIGLFAYGANRITQSCFFSLKDTRTPAKVAALALILNIILNTIFMFPLKIGGIALATSVSGIITFFVLLSMLKKKIGDFNLSTIMSSFLRILLASLCMGGVCYFILQQNILSAPGALSKFIYLGLILLIGIFSYAAFCLIFNVGEMRELWLWFSKKGLSPKGTVPEVYKT